MKKKYIAKTILAITGKVGKRNIFIEFIHTSKGTSYYSTADESIQTMIESCEYYKKGLIVSEDCKPEVEEPVVEKENKNKVYESISKCVDAISLLREEYGITSSLSNKAKILETAKELGISFPNL